MLPSIAITESTPPKPSTASSSRLLYRGALSVPSSHLTLDGLTFSAPAAVNLIDSPLALALESMRGRPTLKFVEVVGIKEGIWLDFSGEICLDIHPFATLSKIYFENTFCLGKMRYDENGQSEMGVKVALGDSTAIGFNTSSSVGTTELVIYAKTSTAPSSSTSIPIQLLAARISPTPPPTHRSIQHLRVPRPDDPTPRKPSLFSHGMKKAAPLKKRLTSGEDECAIMGGGVSSLSHPSGAKKKKGLGSLGSAARVGGASIVSFKIPLLPSDRDVFGGTLNEIEAHNKSFLKKSCVLHLQAHGIEKPDKEFKDLFGTVYRGVCIALRNEMKVARLDDNDNVSDVGKRKAVVVRRVIDMHVKMYVTGRDEKRGPTWDWDWDWISGEFVWEAWQLFEFH